MTNKISIRFYQNREVRAVWDENNSDLSKRNLELVSATNQLKLVTPALTTKINDREMFMKGIDYSYYYEEDTTEVKE